MSINMYYSFVYDIKMSYLYILPKKRTKTKKVTLFSSGFLEIKC